MLLNEAYTAKRVDEQLESNAQDFFSRSQNFRFDGRAVRVSAILNWYGEDFGADSKAQLQRIAKWLPTDAARRAAQAGRIPVAYLDNNWQLNQQRIGVAKR